MPAHMLPTRTASTEDGTSLGRSYRTHRRMDGQSTLQTYLVNLSANSLSSLALGLWDSGALGLDASSLMHVPVYFVTLTLITSSGVL